MGLQHIPELVSAPPRIEDSKLVVHIVYTTEAATRAALQAAVEFAGKLEARLELLVPKVVPFPLPLSQPSIPNDFTEGLVRSVAEGCELDVRAKVLLCRDREDTIPQWLPKGSVAVIGRHRAWGPGSFRSLIRSVKNAGHHVVVVDAR